jgi:hypothetical protein
VRPRALMSVFVCAHARVYVYVQVYVREILCVRLRVCVSASARVCVLVLCVPRYCTCARAHTCVCARV